jgi:coproporphyrinogen III oxidase-like Fe-S oxidoreductase
MVSHTDATIAHLSTARRAGELPEAASVFFGGGTPSRLPGHELVRILQAIPRTADAEVTVECNPDTVSAELFSTYRAAGVTRISFGVQSMVTSVLATLGRQHNPENVRVGVELARAAGFASFNLDLIYGGARESIADWTSTSCTRLTSRPTASPSRPGPPLPTMQLGGPTTMTRPTST